MLVENTVAGTRQIGNLYLMPGINEVDEKQWKSLLANGYKGPVEGLIEDGILVVPDDTTITAALVKKTYDIAVLENWLPDAKGALKRAINKQITLMTQDDEKKNGTN